MDPGGNIAFSGTATVAVALSVELLTSAWMFEANPRPSSRPPQLNAAFSFDTCAPYTNPGLEPGPNSERVLRLPAVWLAQRAPAAPLSDSGDDWIFLPLDGCGGSDTGNFDLRNAQPGELPHGSRHSAIGI
ncbi:MAG: hypothetical protein R3D05_12865 [Dongiaceae bacterium]